MRINVTEKHIKQGCRRDESNCPIVYAILDNLRKYLDSDTMYNINVTVFAGIDIEYDINDYDTKMLEYFAIPDSANNFIESFDAEEKVKPFSFNLGKEYYNFIKRIRKVKMLNDQLQSLLV